MPERKWKLKHVLTPGGLKATLQTHCGNTQQLRPLGSYFVIGFLFNASCLSDFEKYSKS